MGELRKKFQALASALCLVTALLAGMHVIQAQVDRLTWAQVSTPSGAHLFGVFMVDKDTAWAVGGGNVGVAYELNWLGDHWNITERGTFPAWLMAVSVLPDNDVWAVGNNGLIVHRTPDGWREIPNPVPNSNLQALQMFSREEGWAAGYAQGQGGNGAGALLLHYKDGRWTRDLSISGDFSILGLHFTQAVGWASTSAGTWRYSDGRWSKENVPSPCGDIPCVSTLNAVRAISGDEAWAVGSRQEPCPACWPMQFVLHRRDGAWERVLPGQSMGNEPPVPIISSQLKGLTFTPDGLGLAVGVYSPDANDPNTDLHPLLISYRGGRWNYDSSPIRNGDLNGVSAIDSRHALAVGYSGLVLSYGYSSPQTQPTAGPPPTPMPRPTPNPTDRILDPHDPNLTYFPVAGHTLGGGFREYWQQHGGLAQFGYPLTEEFIEVSPTNNKPYTVQYFERARFEWHPENRPPYDVLLGLLGRTVTAGRENEPAFKAVPPQTGPGILYFRETGHNIPPQFGPYWQSHGGLPVYGYPISEAFSEVSPTDGRTYLVQYFERNRFEYHPELPEAYRVSLGLLGVQVARNKGWLP